MSEVRWTPEQEQAIGARGTDVLVAAAAGSGKTAVLVERIIRRLTDPRDPLDVDELLVVTFTEAAAAEMRDRIGAALQAALAQDPENPRLQRQLALLGRAAISTLHSFCLSLIRQYFYRLGLDPAVSVMGEHEALLLRHEVLDELFARRFDEAEDGPFHALVDRYGGGRDDEKLRKLVLAIYDHMQALPWPEAWLEESLARFDVPADAALEDLPWWPPLSRRIRLELELAADALASARGSWPAAREGPRRTSTCWPRRRRRSAPPRLPRRPRPTTSWRRRWGPSTSGGCPGPEGRGGRGAEGGGRQAAGTGEESGAHGAGALVLPDGRGSGWTTCGPSRPTCARWGTWCGSSARRSGRRRPPSPPWTSTTWSGSRCSCSGIRPPSPARLVPSDVARDLRAALPGDSGGRVPGHQRRPGRHPDPGRPRRGRRGRPTGSWWATSKQSIYRFRHADPGLFMAKYAAYRPWAGAPDPGAAGARIVLGANFRSREGVVNAVNFIFRQIMTATGGRAGLRPGGRAGLPGGLPAAAGRGPPRKRRGAGGGRDRSGTPRGAAPHRYRGDGRRGGGRPGGRRRRSPGRGGGPGRGPGPGAGADLADGAADDDDDADDPAARPRPSWRT